MHKKYNVFIYLIVFFIQLSNAQTAPDAIDDLNTTTINTTLNVNAPGVLSNDTDIDGDALTVTEFLINGTTFTAGQTANITEGSILIFADGGYEFIPAANYLGSFPVITYSISDGSLISSANLNLSVISAVPPIANDDYDTAEINTTLNVLAPGVLINDSDPDGDLLSVVGFV